MLVYIHIYIYICLSDLVACLFRSGLEGPRFQHPIEAQDERAYKARAFEVPVSTWLTTATYTAAVWYISTGRGRSKKRNKKSKTPKSSLPGLHCTVFGRPFWCHTVQERKARTTPTKHSKRLPCWVQSLLKPMRILPGQTLAKIILFSPVVHGSSEHGEPKGKQQDKNRQSTIY